VPSWCRLVRAAPGQAYGFTVRLLPGATPLLDMVAAGSLADHSGIVAGVHVVGINYTLLSPASSYKVCCPTCSAECVQYSVQDVVALIRKFPRHVTLLLAPPAVYDFYVRNQLPFDFDSSVPFFPQQQVSRPLNRNLATSFLEMEMFQKPSGLPGAGQTCLKKASSYHEERKPIFFRGFKCQSYPMYVGSPGRYFDDEFL